MSRFLFIIFILSLLRACQEVNEPAGDEAVSNNIEFAQFQAELWQIQDGLDYPHRNLIVNDLIEKQLLKTLNSEEIVELLGAPDRMDNNYLFYTVHQRRIGLWPLHTKTLVIETRDSLANRIMIHE